MKNITTPYLLAACVALMGCGSEGSAPNTPLFIPPDASDDAQAENGSPDEMDSLPGTLPDTQFQDVDIVDPEDVNVPDDDVTQQIDGEIDGGDDGDAAVIPDIAEDVSLPTDSNPQTNDISSGNLDSGTSPDGQEEDDAEQDTLQPEMDVKEPGECEFDNDCLLLTKKTCCPEVNVCTPVPEAGTLNEEVEALAWLTENCLGGAENECPELVAPECPSCIDLFAYAPVCDKEIGECVLDKEPICEAYCEAKSLDVSEGCPMISAPDEMDGEAFSSCICP